LVYTTDDIAFTSFSAVSHSKHVWPNMASGSRVSPQSDDVIVIDSSSDDDDGRPDHTKRDPWVPQELLDMAKKKVFEHFRVPDGAKDGGGGSGGRANDNDDDDDDDEIEIVSEKVTKRNKTLVSIQLSKEEQDIILRTLPDGVVDVDASSLLRVFGKKSSITRCSIIVGDKAMAEAEAKHRQEQRQASALRQAAAVEANAAAAAAIEQKRAAAASEANAAAAAAIGQKRAAAAAAAIAAAKRKFGTELRPEKKKKQRRISAPIATVAKMPRKTVADTSMQELSTTNCRSFRSSSDRENTTPPQSKSSSDKWSESRQPSSYSGSFKEYIQQKSAATTGPPLRRQVAKKQAAIVETPSWGSNLPCMRNQYGDFLTTEVNIMELRGGKYVPVSLFDKVYACFSADVPSLIKKANTVGQEHFIYSGWSVSHVSLIVAKEIVASMGRKPAVLYKFLQDLILDLPKVQLLDDLKKGQELESKQSPLLSDLSEEEFSGLFGLCTHAQAEKIMKERKVAEAARSGRRSSLRAVQRTAATNTPVSSGQDSPLISSGQDTPSLIANQLLETRMQPAKRLLCRGSLKPLFRTTLGQSSASSSCQSGSDEAPQTPIISSDQGTPMSAMQMNQSFDAATAVDTKTNGSKVSSDSPKFIWFAQTLMMEKKGIKFPDGWKVKGVLKPDRSRYHFYYYSSDGLRFKNFDECIKACLKRGYTMSDLEVLKKDGGHNGPSRSETIPISSSQQKRKEMSNAKQFQSSHQLLIGITPLPLAAAGGLLKPTTSTTKEAKSDIPEKATVVNSARLNFIAARKFADNANVPRSSSHAAATPAAAAGEAPKNDKLISKKKRKSAEEEEDCIFNLERFRPSSTVPAGVEGWFCSKLTALRRIVDDADREAMATDEKTATGNGNDTATTPPEASSNKDASGAVKRQKPQVLFTEGASAILDLSEWKQLRARKLQYAKSSSALETPTAEVTAARVAEASAAAAVKCARRKREAAARKIAECLSVKTASEKEKTEVLLPPGCYKKVSPKPEGSSCDVAFFNAKGDKFVTVAHLWAAESVQSS
jgi:hypothetical protein